MSTLAYTPSNFDFFNQNSFDDTTVKFRQLNGYNSPPKSRSKRLKKQELLIVDRNLEIQERDISITPLMSYVKPASINNELRSFATEVSDAIPISSPIFPLQNLEIGWDGYGAEPLSQEVLLRANQIWNEIKKIIKNEKNLPVIHPTANGSVAFSWTRFYPQKELEVSLIDNSTFLCEWLLSGKYKDIEGESKSLPDLCAIIREYMEM
ncbi:hypothetical protein PseudUWO311_03350 [Pseudanabaena sp. UWO311]|uniref:hypothetical protein n=1 Tax=Pseudanabaena sp. UWO311 TaxID=2487337 RepID=UPI00115A4789|nr:hypothetical protein [Pseudanabaena sp. UWO311]TYQ29179.1 hypothetical protein PseudUWO311_03350 [Pseudanabaena sp. UWO311]